MKTAVKILLIVWIITTAIFSWLLWWLTDVIANFNSYVIAYLPLEIRVLFLFLGFILTMWFIHNSH